MQQQMPRRDFLRLVPAAAAGGVAATGVAGTRVFGADCSDGDGLTAAELEGRRQVAAVCDLLREHFMDGRGVPLGWLPAKIGIRETRHVRCLHSLTADELLVGKRFPDAVVNGTYHIDVHSASGAGVKFRELNEGVSFYQVPYASLVPRGAKNLLIAGRSIDADEQAFGAVRVMVNCNQTGQAAGAAAWLALDSGTDVASINTRKLRTALSNQGAVML
ncbi:MAG: FAD-dependent oxidoreductase [Candidatus Nealsonbacteria bacterium]|nr:FAD-dependent oxidoreductase [Candidatus Nealsonbacteria bacterium]